MSMVVQLVVVWQVISVLVTVRIVYVLRKTRFMHVDGRKVRLIVVMKSWQRVLKSHPKSSAIAVISSKCAPRMLPCLQHAEQRAVEAEMREIWGRRRIIATGFKMPIYEYCCEHCHHQKEALQGINDPPLLHCEQCQHDSLKRYSLLLAFV